MKKFSGVYTALITPLTDEDHVDEEGLQLLIQRQIEADIDGIVILGSTGESSVLTQQEKKHVINITKKACCNKTTFIVGTGSQSTKQTIENTLEAEEAGADAVMIVTPYYNKPTQEGLFRHFKAIAEACSLPIILYNAPGRSCVNLHIDTIKRLLDIPSIVGIKEASGNIVQIGDTIEVVRKMRPDFAVFSGDDVLTLPIMALGGDGIISVISNLFPEKVVELVETINQDDYQKARELHFELMPFVHMAFVETNPIPIKAMHKLWGLPGGHCRGPLCDLSEEKLFEIKAKCEEKVSSR